MNWLQTAIDEARKMINDRYELWQPLDVDTFYAFIIEKKIALREQIFEVILSPYYRNSYWEQPDIKPVPREIILKMTDDELHSYIHEHIIRNMVRHDAFHFTLDRLIRLI